MRAVVVARGGGIGDAFLATIVARALRSKYDSVDMIVVEGARELLRGNPDIRVVAGQPSLPRGRYDAAVVTWATLGAAFAPFAAGIRARVGQSGRSYSALFTRQVDLRSERGDRTTHWSQVLLDYARALDCDTHDPQPRVAFDAADHEEAQRILTAARIDGPFAVLHPTRGIAGVRARWPSLPFARLGNALIATHGIPILVTGAGSDRAYVERMFVESRTTRPPFVLERRAPLVNLAGSTSLRSFAALAQRARFVVAMDSGPMHLAASTGTPTLGIFALRSDEPDRWAPLGLRTAVLRADYPCPPEHRKETCPNFACVRELGAARVLAALDGLLER